MNLFTRIPGEVSPVDLVDNLDNFVDSLMGVAYMACTCPDAEAKDVGHVLNCLVLNAQMLREQADQLRQKNT